MQSIVLAEKTYLLLTRGRLQQGLMLSVVMGGLAATVSSNISPWISVVVAIVTFTVFHMAHAARYIVPLPHLVILVCALQYVLAGWVGLYFPPLASFQDTSAAFPYYLAYAGPVVTIAAAVWFLALRGHIAMPTMPRIFPGMLLELDILICVGLAAAVGSRVLPGAGSLAFAVQLIASLRYIGVYGRMVARASGWRWRLAAVLAAEVLFAVNETMFHPLMLWSMWSLAIWLFAFPPSRRTFLLTLAVVCLLLPPFQEAKWRLRGSLEDEIADPNGDVLETSVGYSTDWLRYLAEGVFHTVTLRLSPEFLSDTAARYNQGWIVTRVMFFVPETEPYAMGQTLRDAAHAAVLPRIFAPSKMEAGGHELMARYAGLELSDSTSMDLGYAGEMYANFGLLGGIVGCGVYMLVMALAFRKLAKYAATHPMWWSVMPFIFFPAVKAEDDVGFVLNWAVKGTLVLAVVILLLPNFRRSLFQRVVTKPISVWRAETIAASPLR